MVEFISPDRIEVQLNIESPDSVALNTGMPRNFPRINGYVMIPWTWVSWWGRQVSWITIQRSPYPKRSGFQDFGLIDLPFPLRKMELQPVGTLIAAEKGYKFKRGLETFPSVGDIVILPTETQLKSIIESGENRRVYIGNSPLVGNARVMIGQTGCLVAIWLFLAIQVAVSPVPWQVLSGGRLKVQATINLRKIYL